MEVIVELAEPSALPLARLDIRLPVAGLHSGEAALDANMRSAMLADRLPEIRFHMRTSELVSPERLRVRGDLTVARVTRAVDLDVTVTHTGASLRFTGKETLQMRDFGIEPPVFLGVLRTADTVVVGFDVTVPAP